MSLLSIVGTKSSYLFVLRRRSSVPIQRLDTDDFNLDAVVMFVIFVHSELRPTSDWFVPVFFYLAI